MSEPGSLASVGCYDVFISVCGEKMKRGFADILRCALETRGISASLEMEEPPIGEDVRSHVLQAALSAPILVAIITTDYGKSERSLDELSEMISSKRLRRAMVIPVFFDVRPEHLRMESSEFGKSEFEKNVEGLLDRVQFHKEEKIGRWKDALREASWLSGFWAENYGGHVGSLIGAIAMKINDELIEQTSMGCHDGFIRHRGVEMKKTFASCLYHELKARGISFFLDTEEPLKGEDVREAMLIAAGTAPFPIIIFTQIFASSSWCLDEVAEMVKGQRNNGGKIIPVYFDDVKPEDLRMETETGEFAKNFQDLLKRQQCHTPEKIKEWKDALRVVSALDSGFFLENYDGCQGKLIQAIVAEIRYKTPAEIQKSELREVVQLDDKMADVVQGLHLEQKETVRVTLITGRKGSGKTKLARAIYYRLRPCFKEASIVYDCRNLSVSQIQDRLWEDLLLDAKKIAGDTERKKAILRRRLRYREVLIILDAVPDFAEVQNILDLKSLCPGSRIILTSRDRRMFRSTSRWEADCADVFRCKYEVQPMSAEESWRLFCFHAFRSDSPDPGFETLATRIVKGGGGYPLRLVESGRAFRYLNAEGKWLVLMSSILSVLAMYTIGPALNLWLDECIMKCLCPKAKSKFLKMEVVVVYVILGFIYLLQNLDSFLAELSNTEAATKGRMYLSIVFGIAYRDIVQIAGPIGERMWPFMSWQDF